MERAIYVNKAQRDNYPTVLISPPSSPGRPIFFSETDAYTMHFSHNDALVMTMHISYCRMSKILVDEESSVNILYRHAIDRMEDTPEMTRKMILSQTQSLLYGFNGNEAHSSRVITFPVWADPYNIVTEFYVLDIESSYNAILRRPWIQMMGAIPFTHYQLLKYPTLIGMADIKGDEVITKTIATVAWKKSG